MEDKHIEIENKLKVIENVLIQLEQKNCIITVHAPGFKPETINNEIGIMCEAPIKELIHYFFNKEKTNLIIGKSEDKRLNML